MEETPNEFEGAFKRKAPPRAARRRRPVDEEEGESEDPTPGGAKKSGWGDATTDGDVGTAAVIPPRRRRAVDGDDDDDDNANARKHETMSSGNKHLAEIDDQDNDTIANLIPDLEDEEYDMTKQVASAPHLTKSRVQSIKELDDAIDMALPSANEIGIDLSVLQSYLMPQEQVVEEDLPWDFSAELQALASEMQREKDASSNDQEPIVKAASKPVKERVRKPLQDA